MLPDRSRRIAWVVLFALAVWAYSYRLGDAPLLDDPNEGLYPEVAREMVERGDWMSPHLNGVLFLNKPPLTFWLIALADGVVGMNELAARLPSALAGIAIVMLTTLLGQRLYDADTGLLAGAVLLAMGGFFVATHVSAPDLLLTVGVVGTVLGIVEVIRSTDPRGGLGAPALRQGSGQASSRHARRGLRTGRQDAGAPRPRASWPWIVLQLALAVGLLAKGMLAVVLPGFVLVVLVVTERRYDLPRRLLHPRAWWLLLALMAPWHVAMSFTHPGFLWDYVINQHLLFFFDLKFPRDSEPVSLPIFWMAFLLRLFPWTLFAPLAVVAAIRRLRHGANAPGERVVLAWAGGVLLFFSASVSRMEHYAIPALPAFALLLGKLFRDYASRERVPHAGWLTRIVAAHFVIFALLALTGPFVVPRIVNAQDWLAPIHELPEVARWMFTVLAGGALAAAGGVLTGRRAWAAPLVAVSFVAVVPSFVHGFILMGRANSIAPLAEALRVVSDPDDAIVFEAPVEYQNCASLNFYLRRTLDLVLPDGFVAPPYLQPYVDELFMTRDDLKARWERERMFLVTDPLTPRAHLDGTVPQPYYIVMRDRTRWVVTNQPLH